MSELGMTWRHACLRKIFSVFYIVSLFLIGGQQRSQPEHLGGSKNWGKARCLILGK